MSPQAVDEMAATLGVPDVNGDGLSTLALPEDLDMQAIPEMMQTPESYEMPEMLEIPQMLAEGDEMEASEEMPMGVPEAVAAGPSSGVAGCPATDYRSSGYPQHSNMDPAFYQTRNGGADVPGFDISARYASL